MCSIIRQFKRVCFPLVVFKIFSKLRNVLNRRRNQAAKALPRERSKNFAHAFRFIRRIQSFVQLILHRIKLRYIISSLPTNKEYQRLRMNIHLRISNYNSMQLDPQRRKKKKLISKCEKFQNSGIVRPSEKWHFFLDFVVKVTVNIT